MRTTRGGADESSGRRHVAARLAQLVPVVVGVATAVFFLIHLVPGDPAQAMLGESASPREVADLRAQLGLDRPLFAQYGSFLKGLVTGNLGTSLRTGRSVLSTIGERLPATAEWAVVAMCLAFLAGIPAGAAAAAWKGRWFDRIATTMALLGTSLPSFWLGPLLAILFSVVLAWLPVAGRGSVAHVVLPAITLAVPAAAVLMRTTRASVLEELQEPYVVAARARGASRSRAVAAHAVRNGLLPVVTVFGLQCGGLLTGAVITESIFAWPDVGRLLVQSIGFRDYPVVQGCVLFIAMTYVAVNLLVDVVYTWLDPRVRQQAG